MEAFASSGGWKSNRGIALPPVGEVRNVLKDQTRRGHLDDDGGLILADLTTGARKVIERSHGLAQLRGICPIPSRLLLIAFIVDEHSYTARLFAKHGVHTTSLGAILLELSGGNTPVPFRLGDYAASRIIKPVVEQARQMTTVDATPIDEVRLFQAFCHAAPDDFRRLLRSLPKPWQIDLEALLPGSAAAEVEPSRQDLALGVGEDASRSDWSPEGSGIHRERFGADAWQTVILACHWSRLQRAKSVRTPHLFAALVGGGDTVLATMIRQAGIDPEMAKILILSMVPAEPTEPTDAEPVTLGDNTVKVLLRAVALAERHGGEATVGDIAQAFLADGGGAVGEQLRAWGVNTAPAWFRPNREQGYEGNGRTHR
jgi:hypothetical protein